MKNLIINETDVACDHLSPIATSDLETVCGGLGALAGPIAGGIAGGLSGGAGGEIAKQIGNFFSGKKDDNKDGGGNKSERNDCIKLVKNKSANDINKICGKPGGNKKK